MQDLAAAALLGRRADDLDGQAEVVGDGASARPAPTAVGGDDVVAAGVADAGQGVVLGADRDGAAAPTRRVATNAVGRSQTPVSTAKPAVVEAVGHPRDATLLLVAELRGWRGCGG